MPDTYGIIKSMTEWQENIIKSNLNKWQLFLINHTRIKWVVRFALKQFRTEHHDTGLFEKTIKIFKGDKLIGQMTFKGTVQI